jgi:hypothetical protein
MKKRFILFFVLFSTALSAQIRLNNPEMYLGVNFGVTESMVMFKPAVNQGFYMAYNGGIVFRYIAEKNVGTQIELNYSQRGWTESSGLYTRQLNYIELPFMTHIYVGNKSRFFFNIGPKISYLLSEKLLLDTSGTADAQHITSVQNPFDYGLCGGFGFLFNIRKNIIQLDTRANYSISNIFPDKKSDYFSISNNMNLAVNLAWLFQVK